MTTLEEIMLSASQLITTGYVTKDGKVLCVKCGDAEGIPTKYAHCAYSMDTDFQETGAWCDKCGDEIVEPSEDEEQDETLCTCANRSWYGEEHDSACELKGARA